MQVVFPSDSLGMLGYHVAPLQTAGLSRRLSSAAYDSASSGLPSPTWPTPPHTPHDPKPLLLPPPLVASASPMRMSPRTAPRRLSNASTRFSRRVSIASALSLSRPPSSARLHSRQVSVRLASARSSVLAGPPDDMLGEGDVVGHGLDVNGELVTAVDHGRGPVAGGPHNGLHARYEIVSKLGSGSYATVFLAREVLADPLLPDSDLPFEWHGSDDADVTVRAARTYGRSFAIKCLSRASLASPESLAVQMLEATLHGSLPVHPNVVSLHAALESASCLFLVLEYVPGPDLFYFLEQSRDAAYPLEPDEFTPRPDSHVPEATRTPPTPSLLSALGPALILSPTRLRLISRMFRQMCDAVAACHAHGVSHRDIKPENFIVTHDTHPPAERVVVKLSDFGLATSDHESADMDCGSAPYMSYECRNNCAPTYNPRAADVWSLGIVLINMLYHVNPWSDTFQGACPSFSSFCADPIRFFLDRFAGMTRSVASFLATRVFCIPDTNRIDAAGLANWVKDLVAHFGGDATPAVVPGEVVRGCVPVQREGLIDVDGARELAENGLGLVVETLVEALKPVEDKENHDTIMRTTTSGARKRGKRGAKKNKNPNPPQVVVTLGEDSAAKVQDLARELSASSNLNKKTSKWSLFRVRNESGSGSARKDAVKTEAKDPTEAGTTATVRSLLGSLDAVNRPPTTERYVHPHAPGATHVPPPSNARTPYKPSPLGADVRGRTRPADRWTGSPIGQFGTDSRAPAAPSRSPAAAHRVPEPRDLAHSRVYERASAAESANWRQSTSTVSTGFTHFSNASVRTVSTVATSVSGGSIGAKEPAPSVRSAQPKRMPPRQQSNVKYMEGTPWELDALPRQAYPRVNGQLVQGNIFGGPAPARRNKPPRPTAGLGTISEQPAGGSPYRRADASTSNMGLDRHKGAPGMAGLDRQRSASPEVPKKVQKGQINTLKGMLRAFGAARD
ncbi:Calcium-dependent protein kinase 30 [Ceratobasidium theobromae]|uniref:non-specific serine/threonine protein kinase n=1 Tax=Ceratobasidium theobromae TaxID=1582974 RepID=A0A5N5QBW0_9AGAM|nr:Calcium-dependent protein kinase 30 [Ceratobasidium theobromae]